MRQFDTSVLFARFFFRSLPLNGILNREENFRKNGHQSREWDRYFQSIDFYILDLSKNRQVITRINGSSIFQQEDT